MRALRGAVGVGLVVGSLLAFWTGAASAAILYDQTDNAIGGSGFNSEDDSNNALDSQVAEDFTVPTGQSWQIATVNVGGLGGGAVSQNVNVFLYGSAGAKPGGELFRQLNIATTGFPNFVIPLSGAPALTPGAYWVSVQDFASDNGGGATWAWQLRSVQAGQLPVFRSPGLGGGACTDWSTFDCGGGPGGAGVVFRLDGIASPYTPPAPATPTTPSNKFDFGGVKLDKAKGTATLSVDVPGPGTLSLSGKGVVGQRLARHARVSAARKVGKAGTVKLTVKAKGKAKRKLNSTGKAKVKAKVTFTPTGGTAKTERKSITLKKTL